MFSCFAINSIRVKQFSRNVECIFVFQFQRIRWNVFLFLSLLISLLSSLVFGNIIPVHKRHKPNISKCGIDCVHLTFTTRSNSTMTNWEYIRTYIYDIRRWLSMNNDFRLLHMKMQWLMVVACFIHQSIGAIVHSDLLSSSTMHLIHACKTNTIFLRSCLSHFFRSVALIWI